MFNNHIAMIIAFIGLVWINVSVPLLQVVSISGQPRRAYYKFPQLELRSAGGDSLSRDHLCGTVFLLVYGDQRWLCTLSRDNWRPICSTSDVLVNRRNIHQRPALLWRLRDAGAGYKSADLLTYLLVLVSSTMESSHLTLQLIALMYWILLSLLSPACYLLLRNSNQTCLLNQMVYHYCCLKDYKIALLPCRSSCFTFCSAVLSWATTCVNAINSENSMS